METAEAGFMQAAERVGNARKGDETLLVRFSVRAGKVKEPVLDKDGNPVINRWTDMNGEQHERPQMRTVNGNIEYVEIKVPGDSTLTVCEPVRDSHRERFPTIYEKFKKKQSQDVGTPIAALFPNNPALVVDMQGRGVMSVEQLAGLTDGNAQTMGPIMAFRKKAQDFIAASKRSDAVEQLAKRDEEIAALKAQMAELLAAKRAEDTEEKRGPGRPRKE